MVKIRIRTTVPSITSDDSQTIGTKIVSDSFSNSATVLPCYDGLTDHSEIVS